jgi:hypothetical protein
MAKARKQKAPSSRPFPTKGRGRKLKVFKTPIGFHDAYVAAPSRRAALAAWGAGTDLFSAGIAEQVTGDKKAMAAALERPGEVVRVGRSGSKDEEKEGGSRIKSGMTKANRRPKPSRAAVERAEAAVVELETKLAAERAKLAKEEERLAKRRRGLDERQGQAMARAEAKRDAARERYRQAMAEWEG